MEAHVPQPKVLFEGLKEEEILDLPKETVEHLILLGEPIVFRVGSATLLGSFKVNCNHLVVELAPDRGRRQRRAGVCGFAGETIFQAAYIVGCEWIVHAVS